MEERVGFQWVMWIVGGIGSTRPCGGKFQKRWAESSYEACVLVFLVCETLYGWGSPHSKRNYSHRKWVANRIIETKNKLFLLRICSSKNSFFWLMYASSEFENVPCGLMSKRKELNHMLSPLSAKLCVYRIWVRATRSSFSDSIGFVCYLQNVINSCHCSVFIVKIKFLRVSPRILLLINLKFK